MATDQELAAVNETGELSLPSAVLDFCEQHQMVEDTKRVLQLAQHCFSPVQYVSTHVREDPENGEQWVLIRVGTRTDVRGAGQAYDRYVEAFVNTTPWPQRGKIRLSYNTA